MPTKVPGHRGAMPKGLPVKNQKADTAPPQSIDQKAERELTLGHARATSSTTPTMERI